MVMYVLCISCLSSVANQLCHVKLAVLSTVRYPIVPQSTLELTPAHLVCLLQEQGLQAVYEGGNFLRYDMLKWGNMLLMASQHDQGMQHALTVANKTDNLMSTMDASIPDSAKSVRLHVGRLIHEELRTETMIQQMLAEVSAGDEGEVSDAETIGSDAGSQEGEEVQQEQQVSSPVLQATLALSSAAGNAGAELTRAEVASSFQQMADAVDDKVLAALPPQMRVAISMLRSANR